MPIRYISRQAQLVRSFYSGIGRAWVICPAAFVAALAVSTLVLGMVFYVKEIFAVRGGAVGLCVGSFHLVYILGCLVLRPRTDHILPRYLIIGATACMALFSAGILLASTLVAATVLFAAVGLTASLFWSPIMGWLSGELQGRELTRMMSYFNISWSMGAIISPAFAGWLSDRGAALPIKASSGLFLLIALFVGAAALILPRVREDRRSSLREAESARVGSGTPLRYAAWAGVLASFMVMGLLNSVFPYSAEVDMGLARTRIGALLLPRPLLTTLIFALMGRLTFWRNRGLQMPAGLLLMAGTLLFLAGARSQAAIAAAMGVIGVITAQSYFNSMYHGLEGSANRARSSAIHEALLSTGAILGAILGGFIYEHGSMRSVYLTFAILLSATAALQAVIAVRVKRRQSPPDTTRGAGTAAG